MAVGAGGRDAGRDRGDGLPGPGDRLREQPGRLRDGVRVLRDRAGRLRSASHHRRDRRAGRGRGPLGARPSAPPVQRRVHGHGRAVRQLRPHLGRGRAHPRRPRPVVAPHHACRPSASSPASTAWPCEALPVNLAVSLHAADDDLRNELVPLNRRYPLDVLAEACRRYVDATRRRLSFEWALIADVNDTDEQARRLAGDRATARRPREPDPAQPDARLPDARVLACGGPHLPRAPAGPRRERDGPAHRAAPRSTRRAVSFGQPRWRCVLPDQPSPDEHRELAGADRVGEVLPWLDHRARPTPRSARAPRRARPAAPGPITDAPPLARRLARR